MHVNVASTANYQATISTLCWLATAVKGKAKKWATFDSEHAFSLPYTLGSKKMAQQKGDEEERPKAGKHWRGYVLFNTHEKTQRLVQAKNKPKGQENSWGENKRVR